MLRLKPSACHLRTTLIIAFVVAAGCAEPPLVSRGPDPAELLPFAERYPDAPILVPLGIELEAATIGTVARTSDGRIGALEVWLQLRGERSVEAQRYCFVSVDVEEPLIPSCPTAFFETDGVEIHGDPTGRQSTLRDVNWVRP